MAKILVVDDDIMATDLLGKLLTLDGHQPTAVNNSTKAVETAESIRPDLILLDLMMPELNGFELCEIFRSHTDLSQVPILIVSAMDDLISKEKALNAGAKEFIAKPFMPDLLYLKINVLLKK